MIYLKWLRQSAAILNRSIIDRPPPHYIGIIFLIFHTKFEVLPGRYYFSQFFNCLNRVIFTLTSVTFYPPFTLWSFFRTAYLIKIFLGYFEYLMLLCRHDYKRIICRIIQYV